MIKKLFLSYIILSITQITAQVCGDCSTPNCPLVEYTDFIDAQNSALSGQTSPDASCITTDPITGPDTRTTYHTVTSDGYGSLGLVIDGSYSGNYPQDDAVLYPVGGGCTSGGISPTGTGPSSISSNYEWIGNLTPNTTYVLAITFTISAGSTLDVYCQTTYEPETQDCGDCNNPTCSAQQVPDFDSRSYTVCNDPNPDINGTNFQACYTINSGSDGTIGIVQRIVTANAAICTGADITRTYELKIASNGSCSGPAISPARTNANNVGSGMNPEWEGLTPNQDYILCINTSVPIGCDYDYGCLDYYSPAPSCDAVMGNVLVEVDGTDVTNTTSNEYTLCWNEQIVFTASGFTLPSNVSPGENPSFGFILYSGSPTLPIDDFASDPNFSGVVDGPTTTNSTNDGSDASIFGPNNEVYIVPAIFRDFDGTLFYNDPNCFITGTPIRVNYLNEITYQVTEQCGGISDISIQGGHPEFNSSTYTISNITPSTLVSSNNSPGNNQTFNLSSLNNGDNYSFTITDDNGCSLNVNEGPYSASAASFSIDTPISSTPNTICNSSNGSATVTISGGSGSETFIWTEDATGLNVSNSANASGLNSGTYTVTVSDGTCSASENVTIQDQTNPPVITVLSTEETCTGNDGTITININSGGASPFEYSIDNGLTFTNTNTFNNINSGNYSIVVRDANGCIVNSNTLVDLETNCAAACITPVITLSDSTYLCGDVTSVSLVPNILTTGTPTYLWSTGETTSSINVSSTGTYWIEVTDRTCVNRDTIIVTSGAGFSVDAVIQDETCIGKFDGKITIFPPDDTLSYSYLWENGSTDFIRTNLMPGVYTVTVSRESGCGVTSSYTVEDAKNECQEVVPHIFVPSAFSPNHDGENDILYVRGEGISAIELIIYDRWGQKVFETTDLSIGWNGMFKGRNAVQGVYTYRVTATFVDRQEQVKFGNISLIR